MENNNKREVGFIPDDNNNIRLPGSMNCEPVRGDSAYGQGKWKMGKVTALDVGDTGGVVGKPTVVLESTGLEGNLSISTNANVDVHNSDTSLMAPVGDSNKNLSAKYKYPNVHQDVPTLGKPGTTYSDHS